MTCRNCGRDEGHWLGCAAAHVSRETKKDLGDVSRETKPTPDDVSRETSPETQCEAEGCENAKASPHPRAKYCGAHKLNR